MNKKLISGFLSSALLITLLSSCSKSDNAATPTAQASQAGTTVGDAPASGGEGATDVTGGGSNDGGGSNNGGGSGGTPTPNPTPTPTPTPTPPPPDGSMTADEQKMLTLINNVRATGCNCGGVQMPAVAPVTWNAQLKSAAQGHSDWMFANNTMSHTGANGSDPGARIAAAGYTSKTWGENVAMGFSSVDAVMQGWLGSAGHCKNIMNGNFKEVGTAVTGKYWTQDFGTKR